MLASMPNVRYRNGFSDVPRIVCSMFFAAAIASRRGFYEVTPEERVALWDKLYDEPGFGIWLSNFKEIFTDEAANAEFSAYIADRRAGGWTSATVR